MQKKPLILIICVAVVILAIILLVIYLAKGGTTDFNNITSGKVEKLDEPMLSLSAYPQEETDGSVEISIMATISDGNEIVSVTTPDGKTTGYTVDKVYTVNENGEYSFTVTASNGKTVTKSISIKNISRISADNPYIPEGFTHIDGTEVNTGFVIEDAGGNQYVWVPVETGTLVRTAPSEKYLEDNYTASAFNNSVSKYYGFYIAKYESSKDNVNGIVVAKSVGDTIPWSNVNYDDAFSAAQNTAIAYNYIGVKTALVNSYAWDTTLDWLNTSVTNYSTSRNYGNYTNKIMNTGETESDVINQIADMAGNLREWTTEKYDEKVTEDVEQEDNNKDNTYEEEVSKEIIYRVVRGGSATMDKIANSRIGERTDLQDTYWGFRMVLYKE